MDADPALGVKLAVKGMANRIAYLGISARVTGVKVTPLRLILLSCWVFCSVLTLALSSSSVVSVPRK